MSDDDPISTSHLYCTNKDGKPVCCKEGNRYYAFNVHEMKEG